MKTGIDMSPSGNKLPLGIRRVARYAVGKSLLLVCCHYSVLFSVSCVIAG
jgi:hypothetical protein